MIKQVLPLSFITLCSLLACENQNQPEPEQCALESGRTDDVSEERASVVDDNSQFAWDMYHQLRSDDGNLFFSPTSMSAALDMTRLGAAGDTLSQMAHVLGDSQDEATHHQEQGSLLQELDDSDTCSITLSIANQVFAQTGLSLEPDFEAALDEHYGAPAEAVDFQADSELAREQINEWVADHTEDKIPELFPEGTIHNLTTLVLANAIYMKADWASPFEESLTTDAEFTRLDGSTVSTPMMSQMLEDGYAYAQVDGAQLVELPYEGDELSMVVVVPDETDGLLDIEAGLYADTVQNWLDELTPTATWISMPKLEMRWKDMLNEPLQNLGMDLAFTHSADLSGMSADLDMMIDVVIHEAYVKINEEGTEAAAATGVGVGTTSEPQYESVTADHPFLFLVRDRITDSVLFIGRVADPTAG